MSEKSKTDGPNHIIRRSLLRYGRKCLSKKILIYIPDNRFRIHLIINTSKDYQFNIR